MYELRAWRPDTNSSPHTYWYHTKIGVEGLPMHAWTDHALKQLFLNFAVYDRISSITHLQDNSRFYLCWVWIYNPDLVPLSILCTFLPETADQALEIRDLATPHHHLPTPLEGHQVELILHIDEHHDYAPRDGAALPVHPFTWTPGVFDNRQVHQAVVDTVALASANSSHRRTLQRYREQPTLRDRRDRDLDMDGGRGRQGSWCDKLSCHAKTEAWRGPVGGGAYYRRQAPKSLRRTATATPTYDATDDDSESHGRTVSRALIRRRGREEPRRDSDARGRRTSRSPLPHSRTQVHFQPDSQKDHKTMCSLKTKRSQRHDTPDNTDSDGSTFDPVAQVQETIDSDEAKESSPRPGSSAQKGAQESLGSQPTSPCQALGPVNATSAQQQDCTTPCPGVDTIQAQEFDTVAKASVDLLPPIASPPPTPRIQTKQHVRIKTTTTASHPKSKRQAATKTSIPVSKCAQHRLIKELSFIAPSAPVSDKVIDDYLKTYAEPLPEKAIASLRQAMRLGNKKMSDALQALAEEEAIAELSAS
ncbi:hypothetical protein QOZ80_8AG0636220 [Eleusine coracana subsp. coracana]|nr:hypothetical protein QOZ80_8AG0636220 [Eleusine coracana subsp. coracana]